MHRPSSGSSRLTTWTAVCVLLHVTATRWTTLLPGAGAVSVVALRPDANACTELEGHEIDDTDSSFTIPLLGSYRPDGDLLAASADPPSHNHSNWCIIRKESYVFDLCPLLAPERYTDKPDPGNGDEGGDGDDQGKQQRFVKRIEVKRDTPPTVTHTHYYLSLRGKLDMSSKRWKGRECPEGTWICGIVVNYEHDGEKETGMRLLQVIPIAGNLPLEEGHSREAHGLNATSRLGRAQETARHRELHVILHGGMYAGKNQSALIAFQCDHKADEEKPSSPTYSWTYNGFHVFTWQSKHACATRHAVPAEPEPEPTPSGPDPTPETPPDDIPADSGGGGGDYGEGGQNDDFVLPDDGGMPNRQWWRVGIAGVMWTLALTLCSFYVLYALFPRLRVLVHTYVPLPASVLNVLQSIPHPTMPSSISSSLSTLSSKVTAIPNINPFGSRRGRYRYGRGGRGNFRPGERRLRSWAQEEGVLFDSGLGSYEPVQTTEDVDLDLGGEEDFMINAGTSSLVEGSDRGAPKVRSYGSVS